MLWRRSYDVPPPHLDPADSMNPANDPRYAGRTGRCPAAAECLKDVVVADAAVLVRRDRPRPALPARRCW